MKMKRVILAGPFSETAKSEFENLMNEEFEVLLAPTKDDLAKIDDAEYVVLRTYNMTKEDIYAKPSLKFIQRWGVGYDSVDIEAAGERNVPVAKLLPVNASAVSELVMMHILALSRNLLAHHNDTAKGLWSKTKYIKQSHILEGKTAGILGCGNIGKKVARKLQAFDVNVQYYDMFRMKEETENELDIKYVELEELFKTSDIISIHIPLIENTKHFVGKKLLSLMKPEAIIINAARGGIVNESDLYEALKNKIILGAGIETFEQEPVNPDNPLLRLHNVTLTPHIGGAFAEIEQMSLPVVAQNILAIDRGEDLPGLIVNRQFFK
jgi:phosphoglycerate dehydrogenase-like enzyme